MSFLICHRLFRQLVFGTSAFCSAFQFQLLAAGRVLPSKRKGSLTFFERNSSKLTGNMSALKQRQHETKIPMMYGDLVHMTFLIVIMPRYLTLILERKDEDRTLDTGIPGIPVVPAFFPTYIFVGTCLDLIFVSLSCLGGSRVASILSYVMSVTNTFATMLLQWPLPDNGDLLRFIFVYQIIVNAANQGHGFRVKTMMTLFSFTSAVCLCYLSPLFQLADYLPWLCGSTGTKYLSKLRSVF